MWRFISQTVLVTFLAMVLGSAAAGDELIQNSSLDDGSDGWINQAAHATGVLSEWLPAGGRNDSGGIHIRSGKGAKRAIWIWRYVIKDPPKGQRLRFSGWAKGKQAEPLVAICVQAWDAEKKNIIGFASTQSRSPLQGDFDWTRIEAMLIPPAETKEVHLLAFLSGSGEVWFDDISMVTAGAATAEEIAAALRPSARVVPGLFKLRGEYVVRGRSRGVGEMLRRLVSSQPAISGDKPTLLFPLPLSYREQVPLTYQVVVKPPEKLSSARIYEDQPGNYVAEVVLAPPAGEEIEVHWSSIVLCAPRSFDDVPKEAPFPDGWPEAARVWLRSTRCVQSEDERIQSVAREIRGDSQDVLQIIGATLERMQAICAAQEGRCRELDAVEALERRGSCTSAANLCAALLRANGIPARILSGYPPWCGPLQTHYIVEAYVPGYGWYPIESTKLEAPWPPCMEIHVAVIPPEYEDRSERRRFVAGGVPYLSLTERKHCNEGVTVWGSVAKDRNCDHVAETWRAFPPDTPRTEWDAALQAARQRWAKWASSTPRVEGPSELKTPFDADDLEPVKDVPSLMERLQR